MMIKNFKKWMEINRNFSKCTVDNYIRSIEKFNEYLSKKGKRVEECQKITINDIETRLAEERQIKESKTCNNYLA